MRIGEMTTMMRKISRNQTMYAQKAQKADMQLATGKRVNSAADDPSAIGRIQRTKAEISTSKIAQSSLSEALLRNDTMETTLNLMSESATDLNTLALQKGQPGADRASLETQAATVLDSMVSAMAGTSYNGVNPFAEESISIDGSGGGSLTVDSPEFNIVKNGTDPTKYDITLNDGTELTGKSVSDILNSSFIQDNLSSEITNATSSVGISNNVINRRKSFEVSQEETLANMLSNIEDADMAQASIDSAVSKKMVAINQTLMTSYASSSQSQISSLLNIIA